MKSLLRPQHYTDETIFREEQTGLFASAWLFAGFTSQLGTENDFILARRGGTEILVQRLDGELRAFVNVCAHRQSRLQTGPAGCRPLICPYHGWRYGSQGELLGVPEQACFSAEELAGVRLRSVRVASSGPLVFVNLNSSCAPLADFLGEAGGWLKSLAFSGVLQSTSFEQACNWKVAVENTLEFYHVNLVHRNSFARLEAKEGAQRQWQPHSMTQASLSGDARRRIALDKSLAHRAYRSESYEHLFVFPNLTVATSQGFALSIQYFAPLASDRTLFATHTLACAPASNATTFNPEIANAVALQTAQFNNTVFEEDRLACERVQAGLADAGEQPALLGRMEMRIASFHEAYFAATKNGAKA